MRASGEKSYMMGVTFKDLRHQHHKRWDRKMGNMWEMREGKRDACLEPH